MTLPRRLARCARLAWDLANRDQSEIDLIEESVRSGGSFELIRDTSNQCDRIDPIKEPSVLEEVAEAIEETPDTSILKIDDAKIQRGVVIASEVIGRLRLATTTTEAAAIDIGTQVSSLFTLAQEINQSASRSLSNVVGDNSIASEEDARSASEELELSVIDLIYSQKQNLSAFVDTTEQFVDSQKQSLRNSSEAVFDVRDCVRRIDKIVLSSEVLALNVQIESVRLGEHGKAFSVLGEQMSDFSKQIHQANQAIQKAAVVLSEAIHKTQSQFDEMGNRVGVFSGEMARKMSHLESRTNELSTTLHQTLTDITQSNNQMMTYSRLALSALQFQDPLSQDLLRSAHEIQKLRSLIQIGDFDDTKLADIDPSIGNDGTTEREAGYVDFF